VSSATCNNPGIDLERLIQASIRFGVSADTRSMYPLRNPSCRYTRPLPVALTSEDLPHLGKSNPSRPRWLQTRTSLIIQAITAPVVIYRDLQYKGEISHWSQLHAVPDTLGTDKWVAVVMSLANFDIPLRMQHHRIITIIPASRNYLFKMENGVRKLKPEYIYVKK